jgi:Tfp pilus assembly protein PilF
MKASSPAVAPALIVSLTLVAYAPALSAGFIWDDDGHVTRPALRGLDGLGRIWFDVGATQQYYPVLHTFFWIEHRLWGNAAFPYHLVNVLLHATVACLFLGLLRSLAVPGSLAAAAVFAVHPVHVESVAWITEQKNTLSACWYLAALGAYLRFSDTRRHATYAAALGAFVLALLTKSVTATLPAAALVILWWRHGRLDLRKDVVPLLPFFAAGVTAGLTTAWIEQSLIGATGDRFALAPAQRLQLAGRVVWFYLGSLAWPAGLTFIYPRWSLDAAAPAQWTGTAAAVAVTAALVWLGRRVRSPVASWLLYCGTLFPVLGFFNVYPFRFSYVADHFQYVASMAIFALAGAGAAAGGAAVMAWRPRLAWAAPAAVVAAVALLAAVTWRQCHDYLDAETLYRATLTRNPACTMALHNLALLRSAAGDGDEALDLLARAAVSDPSDCEVHVDLGVELARAGRFAEAIAQLERAAALDPASPLPHGNLGAVYMHLGDRARAVKACERAVALRDRDPRPMAALARCYEWAGMTEAAQKAARRAADLATEAGAIIAADPPAAEQPGLP